MKKTYFIGFLSAALALVGCATQQPATEPQPTPSTQIGDLRKQLADKNSQIDALNAKIADLQKQNVDLATEAKAATDDQAMIAELNKEKTDLQDQVAGLEKQVTSLGAEVQQNTQDLNGRIARLQKEFAPEIVKGDMEIKQYREALIVSVKESVFFVPDWPTLLPGGQNILHRLAPILKEDPSRIIRVEGNTAVAQSSASSLKAYPTSWHLGAARASNVVQYLQEKEGMNPMQLVVSSLGQYRPVADNGTEMGKAKNRRVDFVLVPRDLWELDRLKDVGQGTAQK
jgi:chemotaxis protein MotB